MHRTSEPSRITPRVRHSDQEITVRSGSFTIGARRISRVRTLVGAALALLGVAALAEAHDFWLVPNAFTNAPGEQVVIRGQTSSRFPTSESAVATDRVASALLLGASSEERIADLSTSGTSLVLRHRPTTPGQRVIAVQLHPRSMRESAASFRRYLELEGAPDALARVDREGLLRGRDSVTRRYAKYAKTIVEIGTNGARAFSRTAGHPLEFIPQDDPTGLRVGDTLRVRLVYRGQPLAGIRVHSDVVDSTGSRPGGPALGQDAVTAPGSTTDHVADADGLIRVPVTRAGLWNVRTIHIVQADARSGADWDAHWATLVFSASVRR